MVEEVSKIKKEHLNNYKKAVEEIILNNNKALFLDDINLLLQKPPLDSMDLIKSNILTLGKKYHVILNTEEMDKALNKYRNNIKKEFVFIQKIRKDLLLNDVKEFEPVKQYDIIRITKKKFSDINKKLKKKSREVLDESIDKFILKNVELYISNAEELDDSIRKKFINDFLKYMKKKYPKQVIENIELKILVKDTTLINGIKEQGERYLFTNSNSRLFNEK